MTRIDSPVAALIDLADQAVVPAAVALTVLAGWYNWRAWRRSTASSLAPSAQAVEAAGAPSVNPSSPPARVSALVAAWNEADLIEGHIRSFQGLRHANRQLVLCAGGSDGTLELARRFAGDDVVVLEQLPGEGKQRALARSFAACDGEVIVLTDGDCLFDDTSFEAIIEPIVSGESAVTTGFAEPIAEERDRLFVRFQWLTYVATLPVSPGRRQGVLGRNCALRRDVVERLRPFDVPAPTGTDYVLSMVLMRAGIEVRGVPESRIATRYPLAPRPYLRMWRRWIKNVLVHAPRYGARRELAATLGAVGLAWFTLATPLAIPLLGRVALVAPLVSLAVASMNRMRRLAVGGQRTGTRPSWQLIVGAPLMVLLDQAAALLAAYDSVAPGRRTKWR